MVEYYKLINDLVIKGSKKNYSDSNFLSIDEFLEEVIYGIEVPSQKVFEIKLFKVDEICKLNNIKRDDLIFKMFYESQLKVPRKILFELDSGDKQLRAIRSNRNIEDYFEPGGMERSSDFSTELKNRYKKRIANLFKVKYLKNISLLLNNDNIVLG
ncbi:MAG: hypothetical protein N4A45_06335 [Flavobacteriales bacterium]|jgi:hypothetical protein|nr:hypothetical protein [Flavobacteriales bacterium]